MKVLDRSWKNCLRMWKWISENLPKGFSESSGGMKIFVVGSLKRHWLRKNKFTELLQDDCFFCAYDNKHGKRCEFCPAGLVKKHFRCTDTAYNYAYVPVEFYNKLVKLDKIRRGV